ncbi:MAG: MFS transporter [Acholeplasmatales bacterium]|jgi:Na+/melibiose symporter-like transporter|nr:MFS transporter [Acholeplasmatales bacterium]
MENKIPKKIWVTIVFFGLIGQIAWQMENMQFNVYVYNTITENTLVTALMVACSAGVATLTTIFIGGICDKVGKKREFIAVGYIIWGFSTVLFGVANLKNFETILKFSEPVLLVSIFVVLLDCLMTFFGSTSNDVAFNAWLTENVNDSKRGVVEGVVSLLGPIAGLIVVGIGLVMLDEKQLDISKWEIYYLFMGVLISACGVLGLFLIPKDKKVPKVTNVSIWKNVSYGFLISTIKENKVLYIALLGAIIEGIAFQTFYPYLIIYIQHSLNMENYFVPMVVIVLATSLMCFVFGFLGDKIGIIKLLIPGIIISFTGLIGLFFTKEIILLCIFGSFSIGGLMSVLTLFIAIFRNKIPLSREAGFQGVRIVSVVLIPMITGPFIGSLIAKTDKTYFELGTLKEVPSNYMFLASALITLLIIIPTYLIVREIKREKESAKVEV